MIKHSDCKSTNQTTLDMNLNRQDVYQQTRIAILGTGWLGFPLSKHFVSHGFRVNTSTRSESKLASLSSIHSQPFLLDLEHLPVDIQSFLDVDILIINITSKAVLAYTELIKAIEQSSISKVLFISSTSVYPFNNCTITEADGVEITNSPLVQIENQFRNHDQFKTTVLRLAGLIGYNRQPGKFFINGKVVHNPDANVNLIHRDDCIAIIHQIIKQEVWGDVFSACADSHPTKRAFYSYASKSIGYATPDFEESDDQEFKIISNKKLKKALNYQFLHPDLMRIDFSIQDYSAI